MLRPKGLPDRHRAQGPLHPEAPMFCGTLPVIGAPTTWTASRCASKRSIGASYTVEVLPVAGYRVTPSLADSATTAEVPLFVDRRSLSSYGRSRRHNVRRMVTRDHVAAVRERSHRTEAARCDPIAKGIPNLRFDVSSIVRGSSGHKDKRAQHSPHHTSRQPARCMRYWNHYTVLRCGIGKSSNRGTMPKYGA